MPDDEFNNEAGYLVITFRFPGVWRKVASHE